MGWGGGSLASLNVVLHEGPLSFTLGSYDTSFKLYSCYCVDCMRVLLDRAWKF